ncbi:hypothetical protein [Stieleria mannarensis]|uniref:hypothetical protein n=1 Tax=Stieleria mannarensis TaxID=2755585 RepID=UPI0016021F94|nr:hypothetical protein [Rhodopirellula sp. JC639]
MSQFPNPQLAQQWRDRIERFAQSGLTVADFCDRKAQPRRRRRKKKSEKLPDHLKRKVIESDVPVEQRICPCRGEEMPIGGTDISNR